MPGEPIVACDGCERGYPLAEMRESDTGDLYCRECAVLLFLLFDDDEE